ncbi:hypothetical protein [Nocardiopsis composta]|uniref:Uncharacterized protein n=1 Tax=Nocardiopsis composta TaxID=157465 RepID=A0A7W8QK89_9ACTN|nr:hypothetical protein [Nocardiopsis composta]MBB5431911.1 hypothetical protein [Nocardiopsis composta]
MPEEAGAPTGAEIAERTLESARQKLAALDGMPVAEHPKVFDELHRELSAVLGGLEGH